MIDQETSKEGKSGATKAPEIETLKNKTSAGDPKGKKESEVAPDPLVDPPPPKN